jgi:hypothetical protein
MHYQYDINKEFILYCGHYERVLFIKFILLWLICDPSDVMGLDLAETFTRPALECSDHVSINI